LRLPPGNVGRWYHGILFEFLFNATGRINRAKYWRSLMVFGVAGLLVAVILFTAAGIAAPVFVIDARGRLDPVADLGFRHSHSMDCPRCSVPWQGSLRFRAPRYTTSWRWQDLHSRSGDFLKSAACPGPMDRTATAPTRFCEPNEPAG
jgi:hypothetical protein